MVAAALEYRLLDPLNYDGRQVDTLRFRRVQISDLALQERIASVAGETAGTIAVLAAMCGLPADVFGQLSPRDSARLAKRYDALFGPEN